MIKLFFSVFLFSSSFLYTQDVAYVPQYTRVICSGCTVFVPFKKGMSLDEIYYEANKIYTQSVSKMPIAQRAPVFSLQSTPVTPGAPAIEQQLMALSDSINKEFDQVMQYNSSLYSKMANMQLDKEINEKKQEEMAQREHDLRLLKFIRQLID